MHSAIIFVCFFQEYTEEIERLRRDLNAAHDKNGVYVDPENYENMKATIEEQKEEIAYKISRLKALEEQMEKNEVFVNVESHVNLILSK